ncbi:carboxypeptidase regulatory-like domain-containing protein [Verrucomicrobia bacterium]|nr:carboxypeptidase regulatory-like domain-containing protein [Verrucomicrobiota bacterium]
MKETEPSEEGVWQALAPELDQAIDRLNESDRSAIVMRFFERRNLRDIGLALSTTEDSAQKRVSRAIAKLRSILAQQGVTLSIPILGALLTRQCLASAPSELSSEIASRAGQLKTPKHAALTGSSQSSHLTPRRIAVGIAAALIVGVTAFFLSPKEILDPSETLADVTPVNDLAVMAVTGGAKSSSPATTLSAVQDAVPTEQLKLIIQSEATGERLPGVQIRHRAQGMNEWDVKDLRANRVGEISIPVDNTELKMLQLITRIDGYADTRLEWHPSRGDPVPSQYTLSLGLATRIGGRVIDLQGNPIANSRVGFNHDDAPAMRTRPKSFEFSWIQVETDEEGRWEINRIANEILPLIYGSAGHDHFAGSPRLHASRDRSFLEALKAGTHEFKLAPVLGMGISGIVTDEAEIPISEAKIAFGRLGSRRTTTSDLEGRFTLLGCDPGKGLLTANAESFAANTINVDVESNQAEVHITLKKGRLMTLKVVDTHGVPITGAKVRFDTNLRRRSLGSTALPTVQVRFSEQTDAEGRVVWGNAPDRELRFQISAKGFMKVRKFVVRPDDREHQVTLPPALTVTGVIVDQETGLPIPEVRMITGWPRHPSEKENPQPIWSDLGRFWVDFSGGEFYHSYKEPAISGIPNPGYLLKFEAKGYAPYVTRLIEANEGVVQLEIKLVQAEEKIVHALLPDGTPAIQADVAFVVKGGRINLSPGSLSRGQGNGNDHYFTDSEGRFTLKPDQSITSVVVIHPEGFKHATIVDLRSAATIQLESWGRLSGRYDRTSGVEMTLEIGYGKQSDRSNQVIRFDSRNFIAEIGPTGEFTFERLPPGIHRLNRRYYNHDEHGTSWSTRLLEQFEITANQTTHLDLRGQEIRVSVHLPSDLPNVVINGAYIHEPTSQIPLDIINFPEQVRHWVQQQGNRVHLLNGKTFSLTSQGNGTWSSQDVIPGSYQVTMVLKEKRETRSLVVARAALDFTVNEVQSGRVQALEISEWDYAIVPEE